MNRNEALGVIALIFLISPIIIVSAIPESLVYQTLEGSLLLRFLLLYGWPLGAFFFGATVEEDIPLIAGLVTVMVSTWFIISSYHDLTAHAYVATTSEGASPGFAVVFFGCCVAFSGFGNLVRRAIENVVS